MTFKFQVTQELAGERVANLFVSFVEGSYSPWLAKVAKLAGTYTKPEDEKGYPWYSHGAFFEAEDFSIEFRYYAAEQDDWDNEKPKGRKVVGRAEVLAGLQALATKYPRHMSDILNENDDALTADLFAQCIIFGEEIYC